MDLNTSSISSRSSLESAQSIFNNISTSTSDDVGSAPLQSTLQDSRTLQPHKDLSQSGIEESIINESYASNTTLGDESYNEDDNDFGLLKNKFKNIDRENEKETILLIQELLELAFKPCKNYALSAIEMVLQLPLNSYAKHLVKLYKYEPSNECFTKMFFEYLGCYNQYPAIQKSILRLMLELVKDYHNYGKKLSVIWFGSSPFRSMFLNIHETGYDTFLNCFNKAVIFRQQNPVPDEFIIIDA